MVANERQRPLRFLVALAIVLLLVYCVSLSVFLVYLMRDYSLLKQHVQDLSSRVDSLSESRVTTAAGTSVMPAGNHKQHENKESKLYQDQQVGICSMYYLRKQILFFGAFMFSN